MKAVVAYKQAFDKLVVGKTATITGVTGHPKLGNPDMVRTSRIVEVFGNEGTFETLNTRYVKEA